MIENTYIHGTTSSIFATLAKTEFKFMSPIKMLETYGLAPMGGEITEGGLAAPASICSMCFGVLKSNGRKANYSKEHIIAKYANAPTYNSNVTNLNNEISSRCKDNLTRINELIVLLARSKQWGINNIQIPINDLSKEFYSAKQFFYLILCLADYGSISEEAKLLDTDFYIDNFDNKKIHGLIKKLSIDIEDLWRNPTPAGMRELELLFTAEGEYSIYTGDKITLPKITLYNFTSKKNEPLNPHNEAGKHWGYLIKNSGSYQVGNFMARDLYNSNEPNFRQISMHVLTHIEALQKRYHLLLAVINAPAHEVELTQEEKCFVTANFPVILVLNDEKLITMKLNEEYRVGKSLVLGKDIKVIATDTIVNQDMVRKWLLNNNMHNIKVISFDDLKPKTHTYLDMPYGMIDHELMLKNICDNTPRNKVSNYDLRKLYDMSTMVGDIYTVRQHTIKVLQELEIHPLFSESDFLKNSMKWPDSLARLKILMRAIVLLHAIGNGLDHDTSKRYEKTLPILKAYLRDWGFGEDEVEIAENLVGNDLLEDLFERANKRFIKDIEIKECVSRLKNRAFDCGLDLLIFFRLQCLYYISYACSYPHIINNHMRKIVRGDAGDFSLGYFLYIPKSECFLRLVSEVENNMFEQDLIKYGSFIRDTSPYKLVPIKRHYVEGNYSLLLFPRLQKEHSLCDVSYMSDAASFRFVLR